jgi:hypothetical protein
MKSRLAATLVLIALAGPRPAAAADSFKVIVNARMTGRTVSRETLTQVYLGKVAVGYVSADAVLPDTVHAVAVQ